MTKLGYPRIWNALRRQPAEAPHPIELNTPHGYPEEDWSIDVLLVNACIDRGVRFSWIPTSSVLVPLRDLEVVLTDLPAGIRVVGFETFELEGYSIIPRSDYMAADDPGVTVVEALENIRDWPRDANLWILPFMEKVQSSGI